MIRLEAMPGSYAVCRLAADALPPEWTMPSEFLSITRTPDELSIVCSVDAVPRGAVSEIGFRLLKVAGKLPFDAIGIIAGLTRPLASAGIPVICISTYETDYLLVRDTDFNRTLSTLRSGGFDVAQTDEHPGS